MRGWVHSSRRARLTLLAMGGLAGLAAVGCTSLLLSTPRPEPRPISELVGVHRRQQLRGAGQARMASPRATSQPSGRHGSRPRLIASSQPASQPAMASAASQPAAVAAAASQPAGSTEAPYRLDLDNIIRIAYQVSPLVIASREEMQAAQHALDEFKANLSRFEPFVETSATANDFPRRRHSEALNGEVSGGIEKETFEGAVLRLQGGYSASRVHFGDVNEDAGEKAVEEGDGGLLRARLEVPFVGSRRRQERVISQAFQESSARRAKLLYITNYRTYVLNALSYYQSAVLYRRYVRTYETKLQVLHAMLEDRRVRPEDRLRIESNMTSSQVLRDQYDASFRDSSLSLASTIGIDAEDEYEILDPPYAESRYLAGIQTPEGVRKMLEDAIQNNPRFRVLEDAIADTELQRRQALAGDYDITAFVQGTQFPLGAASFDDRVSGWEFGGGVTVRLNDKRVLTATRLKAEAEIRQFKAQIEAERLRTQLEIVTQTNTLRTYHAVHQQIIELEQQKHQEFDERKRLYLETKQDQNSRLMIDDVLYPLDELIGSEVRLASNAYSIGNAESALMGATGDIYRMVGMEMEEERKSASSGGFFEWFKP